MNFMLPNTCRAVPGVFHRNDAITGYEGLKGKAASAAMVMTSGEMTARYLGFSFAIMGFLLGVLMPLFWRLMTSLWWMCGLALLGLLVGLFVVSTVLDFVELKLFESALRSVGKGRKGHGRQAGGARPGWMGRVYSFGIAFGIGLAAALIFSPMAVVTFLNKALGSFA